MDALHGFEFDSLTELSVSGASPSSLKRRTRAALPSFRAAVLGNLLLLGACDKRWAQDPEADPYANISLDGGSEAEEEEDEDDDEESWDGGSDVDEDDDDDEGDGGGSAQGDGGEASEDGGESSGDGGSTDGGSETETGTTVMEADLCNDLRGEVSSTPHSSVQFVDTAEVAASYDLGTETFRDTYEVGGSDAEAPVYACVYNEDSQAVDRTEVLREDGAEILVHAAFSDRPDVIVLVFFDQELNILAESPIPDQSQNFVWYYSLDEDGSLLDHLK
ncbi:MAG: hypothetical protein WC777_05105 [Candidatus Gracilibacteria bacterium]|jgi:hypothetical protein